MKSTLQGAFVMGGTALILLSGCVVSKKKYEASQAELAKVRSDSAQLAQQVASLNGNVQQLQGRNTTLQSSLDSSTNRYNEQQKSLQYYQSYYKEEQDTLAAVNQEVQGVLSQAGVTNADVRQQRDAVYVRLDENDIFKKNSTAVTPAGQQVLDGIARVLTNRPDANVTVGTGDSAIGVNEGVTGNRDMGEAPAPKHHRPHAHHTAASAGANGGRGVTSGSGTAGTATAGTGTAGTATASTAGPSNNGSSPAHKKVHHHYASEGGMAFSSGTGHHPGWSLKQGRMVAVANHFLKNGVPKVNVSLQRPPMSGTPQSTAIRIIIRPSRREFNPRNSSAMAGTE
ncbi:MAG TPA: hypothetical protein VMH27_17275 [Puia sp.]|nr:hypothetical protein [Puia sp.]